MHNVFRAINKQNMFLHFIFFGMFSVFQVFNDLIKWIRCQPQGDRSTVNTSFIVKSWQAPSHFQTMKYPDFKLKEKTALVPDHHHLMPRFEVAESVSDEKKMYPFVTSQTSACSPTMPPSHSSHPLYSEQ